ncbi:MAG: TonB-dependent siderophore receptor [Pseudomonadota bacterium]
MRLGITGSNFRRLATFFSISTALTSAAFGQEQGTEGVTLETVIVTAEGEVVSPKGPDEGIVAKSSVAATKTATDINRIPQSISVVTREQIDMQGADSVGAALRYSPGIRSEAYGSDTRYDWFFLRGFAGQAQGLYLDGLQLRSQAFANYRIDPIALERQELILGPSSSLYGAGSPGGLVNLVSKRPQEDTFYRAAVTARDPLGGEVSVDLNAPLNESGTVLGRFVALGRLSETQVDHVDDNRIFLAPSITFKPQEGTELTLMAKWQQDDTGTATSFLPYDATVEAASFGRIPTDLFTGDTNFDDYDRNQLLLGYEFDHEFDNGLKLSQSSRYSYVSTNYETLYGVGLASFYSPFLPDTLLARLALKSDDSISAFQTDTHVEGEFATGFAQHRFLAGVDYRYEDFVNRYGQSAPATALLYALDLTNPVYGLDVATPAYTTDTTTRSNQLGLYVQDQISITDKFDIVGGLRQDWVNSTLTNHLSNTTTKSFDSALTGRLGANYEVFPGVRPYVSYSTSFNPVSGTDADGNRFEPEKAQQYEVGVKYQDPQDRIRLTAALFDLTRDNVLTTDPNNPAFSVQTGEVRSRGIELQAQANLFESWDLLASYTAYDLEITKSNRGDQGKVPIGVPQQMASLWLNHTFSDKLEGLRIGAGVRYIGESYADSANTLEVPSYVVADAAAGYKLGNAQLSLNVSNLFDKKYVASCAGVNSCYYGERRAIKARLSYEW